MITNNKFESLVVILKNKNFFLGMFLAKKDYIASCKLLFFRLHFTDYSLPTPRSNKKILSYSIGRLNSKRVNFASSDTFARRHLCASYKFWRVVNFTRNVNNLPLICLSQSYNSKSLLNKPAEEKELLTDQGVTLIVKRGN